MRHQITKSITVNANIHDVYLFWANYENFPHFMKNIKSVIKTGERTSHWVMEGPMGKEIEWDARTTAIEEDRRIAWQSFEGDLETGGDVMFTGLGLDQTQITVSMYYDPGTLGEAVSYLFEDPEGKLEEDLYRFKEYCESTVLRSRGTGYGSTGSSGLGGPGSLGGRGGTGGPDIPGGPGTPGTTGGY